MYPLPVYTRSAPYSPFFHPQSGYACLTLHGGKDQLDRESTLSDFKGEVCDILVATSVAARGLDVKVCLFVCLFCVCVCVCEREREYYV